MISTLKISFEDLIKKYKIGFLYYDKNDLLEVFQKLESLDEDTLNNMKLRCVNLWKSNFDSNVVYKKLINNLQEIVFNDL